MRDELAVTDLVTRAQDGDQQAWDALVARYRDHRCDQDGPRRGRMW